MSCRAGVQTQPRERLARFAARSWSRTGNRLSTLTQPQPRTAMTQLDPHTRVYFTPPPFLRGFGCAGCLIAIFVLGGIVGVLLFGRKTLLGY